MFIKNIPLPKKIEYHKLGENKSEIIIEPCYPGYGVTLANSLRRILLSSLEGAAVTAFKIKAVQHEFSTIPYVKEDVVEIILNLKKLRLKLFSDEPLKLELNVKGEKKITAADITPNSQVEIINKNLLIATLTDKKAVFEMEIFVSKGRGYVTVESQEKEKLEIGTIAIDSLYSPVVNVGFEIENVRVGQKTDFEKIILTIETDGSTTPQMALEQSAKILVDHFQQILSPQPIETEEPKLEVVKDADEKIEEIKMPEVSTTNVIKRKRGRPKKLVN